ncbi:hypothetical protein HQS1_45400 [Delftia lacustris]|nr:hypothetical protein HQS1_45400 [Delftia lacustris]
MPQGALAACRLGRGVGRPKLPVENALAAPAEVGYLVQIKQMHTVRTKAAGSIQHRNEGVGFYAGASLRSYCEPLDGQLDDVGQVRTIPTSGLELHQDQSTVRQPIDTIHLRAMLKKSPL